MSRLFDTLKGIPAPKVLTIRDLEDLDNADLRAVHEASDPVKSGNEAA
jgi:hypothetical protein